jgi:hypothetical protein
MDSPLSSRAWILQEQILSPRLVHFTETQLYYQCHAGLESEDGTVKDGQLSSIRAKELTVIADAKDLGLVDLSSPIAATESWWSWIAEYSARSMTFATDRAPAIAGLVEYYGQHTNDAAILGLWKSSLWYDLAWHVNVRRRPPPAELDSRRRLGGFPTWSWLSLAPRVPVTPMLSLRAQTTFDYANKIELVSWNEQWEGIPHASALQSAELVVTGLVVRLESPLPMATGKDLCQVNFEADSDPFLSIAIVLDDITDSFDRDRVLLLLLFADALYEYVLVLKEEIISSGKSCYRRLGAGDIHRPRGHLGYFKDSIQMEISMI